MDNPALVAARLVDLGYALADADANLSRARDAASSARVLATDLATDLDCVLSYLNQALALIARARPDARGLTVRASALDPELAAHEGVNLNLFHLPTAVGRCFLPKYSSYYSFKRQEI